MIASCGPNPEGGTAISTCQRNDGARLTMVLADTAIFISCWFVPERTIQKPSTGVESRSSASGCDSAQYRAQGPGERQCHQHECRDQNHHHRQVDQVADQAEQYRRQRAGPDRAGVEDAESALP